MKSFLKYSALVLGSCIALLYLLDWVYTKTYENCKPRNKFAYILQMPQQQISNVFLGSSRVANHISTTEFTKITKQRTINLGIEGAQLDDNLLELKLLLQRNIKIQRVFLQVDLNYNFSGDSFIANTATLPYLSNPVISAHLQSRKKDYLYLRYIPFYRYLKAGHVIGLREWFFSALGKRSRIDVSDGFVPISGSKPLIEYKLPDTIAKKNPTIDEFRSVCKSNDIELILFCAPLCSKTTNKEFFTHLKRKLPDLHDYSSAMPDSLFYNCGHLDEKGAMIFTRKFAKELR